MAERRTAELHAAQDHCADVVRRADSSFAAAFWMFPPDQRRALHAIYAFCRLADDIADDPSVRGDRRLLLDRWQAELADAYRGRARHPVGVALGDVLADDDAPSVLTAPIGQRKHP